MSTILATATISPTIALEDAELLNSRHVIATLSTRNSCYTLVKRAGFVVLIKDADRTLRSPIRVGAPITGTEAWVEAVDSTRYVLRIWDAEDSLVFTSSYIESAYVLEN